MRIPVLCLFLAVAQHALSAVVVNEVKVYVSVEKGSVDPIIIERIAKSIRAVSEKVFLGKEIETARALKPKAIDTMKKILNQVITGFYLKELNLTVGSVVEVEAVVIPEEQVVETVRVELDAASVHPFWHPVLKDRAAKILPQLEPVLVGLPVQAKEWASEAIQPVLEARLDVEKAFPGFDTTLSVEFGQTTVVNMRLVPKAPLVDSVYVRVSIPDFPVLVAAYLKFALNRESPLLVGLPVKFLKKNHRYLENYWSKRLMGRNKEKYGITVTVRSEVGTFTLIAVNIVSQNLKLWGEGLINGSNKDPNPELRGMLWWKFGHRDFAVFRLEAEPAALNADAQVGYLYKASGELAVAALLELNTMHDIQWLFWRKGKWQIEGVGRLGRKTGEISLGYWLKPYLRFDAVSRSGRGEFARLAIRF